MTTKNRIDLRTCRWCHSPVSELLRGALHGWASANGELVCGNGQTPHSVSPARIDSPR